MRSGGSATRFTPRPLDRDRFVGPWSAGRPGSLFVRTRVKPPEVVVGSIIWVDDAGKLTLRSTVITDYIVPEVEPEQGVSRQIIGTMRDDTTKDEYPFELEVIDADLPGTGKDTVVLKVGDGARTNGAATPASGIGFSYTASGMVATGDIQELDLEIDLETGTVRPAED